MREWITLAGGPAAGGALVSVIGTSRTLLVTALLYLVSAALMAFVPAGRPPVRTDSTSVLADLRGGFDYVLRDRRLRILLPCFALANLFLLGLVGVAVPVFTKNVLHSGPQGLGAMSASLGIGLVAGTLACGRLPDRWKTSQPRIFLLFMISDLLLATVGLMPALAAACTAYALSGLCVGPAATFYRTLLQTIPPEDHLGRVNSIARATSFGLEPVSVGMIGALAARLSAQLVLVAGGLIAAAVDLTGSALSARSRPGDADAVETPQADPDAAVAGP
jgi:Na+/melibiose symporter-like transporter